MSKHPRVELDPDAAGKLAVGLATHRARHERHRVDAELHRVLGRSPLRGAVTHCRSAEPIATHFYLRQLVMRAARASIGVLVARFDGVLDDGDSHGMHSPAMADAPAPSIDDAGAPHAVCSLRNRRSRISIRSPMASMGCSSERTGAATQASLFRVEPWPTEPATDAASRRVQGANFATKKSGEPKPERSKSPSTKAPEAMPPI